VYSTLLGGSAADYGSGIAVDSSGNAYVTGLTFSSNFPVTAGAFQSIFGGGSEDAFVTKLNATGSALVYSTYLGGSGEDQGNSIAVDSADNALVTGFTSSNNFPLTPDAIQSDCLTCADTFVTRLNAAGSSSIFSTYLGGTFRSEGHGIAVDSSGDAYVTGLTLAFDFPTTNPFQQTCITCGGLNFGTDSFFAKISFAATPDFLLSVSSSPPTNIAAGSSAQITFNLTPENGFNQSVSLSCAGAPPASTCSISPPTVTLNGSSVSTATLTVKTTARSDSQRKLRLVPPVVTIQIPILIFVFALLCSLVASTLSPWKRAPVGWLLLLLCVLLMGGWGAGCGNGGSAGGGGGSSGTPVGFFTITLTGSSGGVTHGTATQVFIL
jgi:hypothetical protein